MTAHRSLISKLTRGLVLLVGAWGVLAEFAVYKTRETRLEAEQFLSEFIRLRVGESTDVRVDPLIETYHGNWWRSRPLEVGEPDMTPCGHPFSQVDFAFENRWLHRVLFAPRTTFYASIQLKDNRVCFRSMGMTTTAGGWHIVDVGEYREGRMPWPFSPVHNLWRMPVTMTAAATDAQRAAAYSINLDCLTKLRGCHDTREMAPAIWRLSGH
jgi:hypothetical protein